MEKEDKSLVKSMLFTASLVFSVLAFCVLIGITTDYNSMASSGKLLNGADLKPLLIMFYIITVLTVATIVASFLCTYLENTKFEEWKNRLILCCIVLITLTVAIYAIMQFSSYISLSEIKKALDDNTITPFARKYYASKLATVMMFATISLLINMFILRVQSALLASSQKVDQPNENYDDHENVVPSEENEIQLQMQLAIDEPKPVGEQMSIDDIDTIPLADDGTTAPKVEDEHNLTSALNTESEVQQSAEPDEQN